MRILTLTSLFPNSVTPRHGVFVRERLRQLVERHDVSATVIAPVPWFPFSGSMFGRYASNARVPAYESDSDIDVYHPRFPAVPRIGNAFTPLGYACSVERCVEKMANRDVDLFDAHYAFPDGVAAVIVARRLRKPIVLTVRGSDINILAGEPAAGWWLRRTLFQCDAVVAVSDALRDKVLTIEPRLFSKVLTIPNGVNQSRFRVLPDRAALRRRLGLSGDVILTVGNLVALKGHDTVVAALPRLPSATLLIVGEGPNELALRRQVADLGVSERVRFFPNVSQDELVTFYNAADVLVLASANEGLPNVVLEAISCGTPVVGTRVGGIPEIIRSLVAGTLVDDRRPETIAGAITGILRGPTRDRESVRAAVAEFDWARTSRQLVDLFDKVTTNGMHE